MRKAFLFSIIMWASMTGPACALQVPQQSWKQTYDSFASSDDISRDVAVDAAGNIFIADTRNHTIRRSGNVTPPTIVTQPQPALSVLGGTAIATDLGGKKTVEIPAGQQTFIKHGGLPESPKAYNPTKLDRWWEKKTAEQNLTYYLKIGGAILAAIVLLIIFIKLISAIARLLILLLKKIFRRKKPAHEVESKTEEKNKIPDNKK